MHRGASVGVGLNAVMPQAPVVPVTTPATAHAITVHRKTRVRHCFAPKKRNDFHSRPNGRQPLSRLASLVTRPKGLIT
jgi:hypothetical protein